MKLLVEQIQDVQYLTEEENGKKVLHIVGPFLQSEQKNKNGRVYRKHILEREVGRYLKEKVERNCAWGELGHPDSPAINLDRVAIRIVSLQNEGNDWVGKARVQNTNYGNIVRNLIEDGGVLGVSSRGCGTLKMQEGINYVQDDYHLATGADVVADPSAPDAYVSAMMEQREWVWNNGIIQEAEIYKIYNEVKKAKKHDLEEAALKAFKTFIEKL